MPYINSFYAYKLDTSLFRRLGRDPGHYPPILVSLLISLLFPCVWQPTTLAFAALAISIYCADWNAEIYGAAKFTADLSERLNNCSSDCSTKFHDPAPVYLIASKISLTHLSSSSTSDSRASSSQLQKQIPMAELVDRFPRIHNVEIHDMHWAVVIRNTIYELLRTKGSSKVELKVSPQGSYSEVDALGIPLKLAWVMELGNTYLTDKEVFSRVQKVVSEVEYYDPLASNCQTIWNEQLFSTIICHCPDQKTPQIPAEAAHFMLDVSIIIGVISSATSVIVLLRDMGFLPFQTRFCSKSNRLLYVIAELHKFVSALAALRPVISKYYAQNRPPIPYLKLPELEQTAKLEAKSNKAYDAFKKVKKDLFDPDTVKLFEKFSDEFVSLVRFSVIALFSKHGEQRNWWISLDSRPFAFVWLKRQREMVPRNLEDTDENIPNSIRSLSATKMVWGGGLEGPDTEMKQKTTTKEGSAIQARGDWLFFQGEENCR